MQEVKFRLANPAACDNDLTVYDAASARLTLRFTFRAPTEARWFGWLVSAAGVTPLWSAATPAVSPAMSFDIPVAAFPPQGTAALVTLLAGTGFVCSDAEIIDTGR